MSFQPVLPATGYTGWTFLNRTLAAQQKTHAATPQIQRDTTYFKANIGKISSAEALVSDPRLLRVALGAFGLDADVNNRFFIRKVLEGGTLTQGALANKLSDKRYAEFSRAFGFGDYATPRTKLSDFGDKITAAYQTRQFEVAVGNQDTDLRLALGLARDLGAVAAKTGSDTTLWFTILGSPPLRQVFETAFGLPDSFGSIDIDKQAETLRNRARAVFGDSTVAQFKAPERIEALTRLFLLRADLKDVAGQTGGAQTALTLLQNSRR